MTRLPVKFCNFTPSISLIAETENHTKNKRGEEHILISIHNMWHIQYTSMWETCLPVVKYSCDFPCCMTKTGCQKTYTCICLQTHYTMTCPLNILCAAVVSYYGITRNEFENKCPNHYNTWKLLLIIVTFHNFVEQILEKTCQQITTILHSCVRSEASWSWWSKDLLQATCFTCIAVLNHRVKLD